MDEIYNAAIEILDEMCKDIPTVSAKDKEKLQLIYERVIKLLGISENGKWCVNWHVEKYLDKFAYNAFLPYAIVESTQNVILDIGANEMLKLICGIAGATAFNASNTKIGVGNSSTPENATQTGLLATSPNVLYKGLESTYPKVDGRTMVFKATFNDDEANFPWNEFAIVNGTGVGGVCMNRKVQNLGTKTTGIWSLQITISVTSNV